MIPLDCRPSENLDWNITETGQLFFQFRLGLEDPFFKIDDEMHFEALSLALKKFRDVIWPNVQDRTKGAVLYRGSANFASRFLWTEKQMNNWEQWKEDRLDTPFLRRLFCIEAFSHYFQMLSHSLPDELPIYLLLDASELGTIAEKHQLLSRTRFEHFQVATKGLSFTSSWIWTDQDTIQTSEKLPNALCLPDFCPNDLLQKRMDQISQPYRVISEAFLTEDWEGVDFLHVMKDFLSEQGRRKLKGFEATGGTILY